MINLWIIEPFTVIYTQEPYILYYTPYRPHSDQFFFVENSNPDQKM